MTAMPKAQTSSPEVVQHIQKVIWNTDTPSWLRLLLPFCLSGKKLITHSWFRSVPTNFSEANTGTLKADGWYTMAIVYIPLALVGIWGERSKHPSQEIAVQLHSVLNHTMELIQAIQIFCLHVMTESHVAAYPTCILNWLGSLQKVLPSATLHLNGHMVCYIHHYLLLFGLIQSWWCFPFEYLIGHIQPLPINHQFGQYSSTQRHIITTHSSQVNWRNMLTVLHSKLKAMTLAFQSGVSAYHQGTTSTVQQACIRQYCWLPYAAIQWLLIFSTTIHSTQSPAPNFKQSLSLLFPLSDRRSGLQSLLNLVGQ